MFRPGDKVRISIFWKTNQDWARRHGVDLRRSYTIHKQVDTKYWQLKEIPSFQFYPEELIPEE